MDATTVAVVLAILSIVGTLAGVVLGNTLESNGEERRTKQAAYEDTIAGALEVMVQLELIEAELKGGPPAPPFRPELARDVLLPASRLGLRSSRPLAELEPLRDAILDAVNPASFGVTADQRAAQRTALTDAIGSLQEAARREIRAHWWNRLWRRQ